MSLSGLGSAALVVAAQFGQPGFPTLEQVQECQAPVSLLLSVAAIQVEADEDPKGSFAALMDMSAMANMTLMSWEMYYSGIFWDNPEFDDLLRQRSQELAKVSFAALQEDTIVDAELDGMIEKGFACMTMAREHELIMNADGSTTES